MPGHEIPEPFKWDKSFETFYHQIDDEHKGLFDGIFECHNHRADGGKLKHLQGVVHAHFTYEEGVMKSKGYSDFADHKGKHDAFLKTLDGFSCPLNDGNIHGAKDWLVNHIKDTDFKYKGKL